VSSQKTLSSKLALEKDLSCDLNQQLEEEKKKNNELEKNLIQKARIVEKENAELEQLREENRERLQTIEEKFIEINNLNSSMKELTEKTNQLSIENLQLNKKISG